MNDGFISKYSIGYTDTSYDSLKQSHTRPSVVLQGGTTTNPRRKNIFAKEQQESKQKLTMVDITGTTQDHHQHKTTKAGRGSKEKKKDKKAKKDNARVDRHNPRAFSVANVVRTKRTQQRNLDRSQKKEYVPLHDRRATEATETPPSVVVVMGPQGVGKSTLIKSLVKLYTNHTLTTVTGPITVVTGKNKRITLFECPNDTASMLDCAKIADLVLLCVDAKFGFEMETFEFLNILQTHGFPKVMGIFTHLDQFRTAKNLRKTKKLLKQRFWSDIYDGAKMFYFSGVINGKYLKNEIKQLTLFISRVKVRSRCRRTKSKSHRSPQSDSTSHLLVHIVSTSHLAQHPSVCVGGSPRRFDRSEPSRG